MRFLDQFGRLARPYFSIPYGVSNRYYDNRTLSAATAAGMTLILSMDGRRNRYPLPSLLARMTPPKTVAALSSYIGGTHPDLAAQLMPFTKRGTRNG